MNLESELSVAAALFSLESNRMAHRTSNAQLHLAQLCGTLRRLARAAAAQRECARILPQRWSVRNNEPILYFCTASQALMTGHSLPAPFKRPFMFVDPCLRIFGAFHFSKVLYGKIRTEHSHTD